MIVDSRRFGQFDPRTGTFCAMWKCKNVADQNAPPYGAPGWVEDLIGGTAYSLTSIFGKYQQPVQQYGFDVGAYMPIILMGGAAVLLVSLMKR